MSTQPPRHLLTFPNGLNREDPVAESVDYNERNEWRKLSEKFKCYASCWCCYEIQNKWTPLVTCLTRDLGIVVCQGCERKFKRKTSSIRAKKFTRGKRVPNRA